MEEWDCVTLANIRSYKLFPLNLAGVKYYLMHSGEESFQISEIVSEISGDH